MNEKATINLDEKLKEHFGYNAFRPYQREIIESVLDGQDVLAILPTGAGKSICYQLPALLLPGTAIVISPLISLMQDQVVSLYKNGIAAAFLNSSLYYQDIQKVLAHLNDYKLIYVAPERFADPAFLQRLKEVQLSLVVIDEAHCISQWGHSFRVEYRKLKILKEHFPTIPIIALTATATPEVEGDIIQQLAMTSPAIIKGSFDRPNLTIRIHQKVVPNKQLFQFLEKQKNHSGIIYAATRKTVDTIYTDLQEAGYAVGRYHAGMNDQDRATSQNEFLHDQVQIMVATVAFGMGIHKPDIRFIVHMDMPRSIEQYYQEIGRAGRDGLPAECLMLYGVQDLMIYKKFLEEYEDPVVRKQSKLKMDKMYSYSNSSACRRKELLNYFGEFTKKTDCQACDNCIDDVEMIDGTTIAQKILSCVFRMRQSFGMRLVIDVLRGSKNQIVLDRGFDRLTTHGLLSDLSEKEVRYYIESLINMGLLSVSEGDYPILKWTVESKAVIDGQKTVAFKKKLFKEPEKKSSGQVTLNYDENVFQSLRQFRFEIAQEEQVPPYIIFSDRSLQEMAVYFPKNEQELSRINGVGPTKVLKYGERFLQRIQQLAGDRPSAFPEKLVDSPVQRKNSIDESVRLFMEGHTVDQIAQLRQFTKGTIITHLAESMQKGMRFDISSIIPPQKQEMIKQIIDRVGCAKLAPIKQQLPEEITYDEIRLVVAAYQQST